MKNLYGMLLSLTFVAACLSASAQVLAAGQPQPAAPVASTAHPAPARKNILILFAYQSDLGASGLAMQGLRAEFAEAKDLTLNHYYEYMDINRFEGQDYEQQLVDLFIAKYKIYPLDLIILEGKGALTFWLAHRAQIAPDAPMVVFDLTPEDLKTVQSIPNMTGLGSMVDLNKSADWIMQARPSVKEFVIVHGAGKYDQQFGGYVRILEDHLAGRAQISDWGSLPFAEVKQRAAALPSSAVIICMPIFQDAAGNNYYPFEAQQQLADVSAVPVLSSFEQFIGTGTIGGYTYSIGQQAGQAAQLGLRILRGEPASSIPLNFDSGNQFIFDHQALLRYHIPLSSLPPGSVIKNRQYTLWETYQPQIILTGIIIGVLSLLAVVLIVLNRNLNSARRSLQHLNASLEAQVQARTTALSSTNAALLESEARFRSYFELPLIGIAITSPEKGWLQVNDSLCAMLGYSVDELAGHTWADLTYPADLAADEAQFNRLLAGEIDSYVLEKRFIRKDGEIFWTALSVGCVRKPDGGLDYTVALLQNISRRKQAEAALLESHESLERRVAERTAELQAANLSLEKAGRMKDQFLAAMSHELRTPLTGVLGLSQVLRFQTYGPLTEKQDNTLAVIEASGQRLLNLINDILDYTNLETGLADFKLVPCSLADVCQASLLAIQSQANAKHQLTSFSIHPDKIYLQADAARLKQMLDLLLGNATKFTPDGGSFGIEVIGDERERQARITVWDTGIGIKSEDYQSLFQPFVQLDGRLARLYNGAGLGLALVRRLVELHGGSVRVESQLGEGSRFSVLLPWQPGGSL